MRTSKGTLGSRALLLVTTVLLCLSCPCLRDQHVLGLGWERPEAWAEATPGPVQWATSKSVMCRGGLPRACQVKGAQK